MKSLGWIKLHRKLLENAIFTSEKGLKVWIWCLLKANHDENEVFMNMQKLTIKSGQFIFGRESASKELKMSPSTVRNWLGLLKKDSYLDIKPTNKYSVITVLKYSDYQEMNNKKDNRITTEKQQNNTNNNVENVENVKKDTIIQGSQLSVIENQKELKRPETLTDHSVSHYVIELFRDLNPDVARLHKLKGEADAALTLYRNAVKGNLDQLERAIRAIPEIAGDTFAPKDIKSISKPSQLLTHWALYCAQARGRKEKITKLSVTRL